MNKAHFIFRILFALLLAAGVKAQVAGPDGHYYKIVLESGLLWESARSKAAESTFNGVHGHLATIKSLEEDQFIEELRGQAAPGGNGSLWVGGLQESDATSPLEGWFWINGEGPFSGSNTADQYVNWQPNEPDNLTRAELERFLTVGRSNIFGWCDEANEPRAAGFVVEYDSRGSDAIVRVKATDPSATENGLSDVQTDTATFEFSRKGDLSLDLPVFYSIHGTAQNGSDYDEISRSIIIPAGDASTKLLIVPRPDMMAVVEPMETVGIRLEPSLILNPLASYKIDPELREAAAVIFESKPPAAGALEIAVPRRGTTYDFGTPVTVLAALYFSNAVPNVDFFAGNIKIGTSPAISREGGLQFHKFTWTNPPPGTHALFVRALKSNDQQLNSSVVEIVVNATADTPVVSIRSVEVQPGTVGGSTEYAAGVFEVSRTGPTNQNLQVFYTVGGTATAGEDYEALQGYVVIGAGKTIARIAIAAKDDLIHEPTESVILTLIPPSSASSYYAVDPEHKTAQVSIFDNDPEPPAPVPTVGIVADQTTISEVNSGPGNSVTKVTVTRTGSFEFPLRVYLKYDGTATPGEDYSPNPATIVIPATRSSYEFELRAQADVRSEDTETVIIAIVPPPTVINPDPADHRYEINPDRAFTTIQIKDNPIPVVGIWKIRESTVEPEPNVDPTSALYALRRTGPTNNALSVYLAYSGTATEGTDYPEQPRVIEIPAGKLERLVEISAKDDLEVEGDETIIVGFAYPPFAYPPPYVTDTNHLSVTLVIKDNDVAVRTPVVRVDAPDKSATEFPPQVDAIDPARFVISRIGGDMTGSLQVFFSLHGTAINGVDYQRVSNSVTILAGQDSASIYIWPQPDREPLFHKYEIVKDGGLSWEMARRKAEEMTYLGVKGHLATINSRDEDEEIEKLRLDAGAAVLWVGGYQEPDEPSVTEGWKWVNNEGPIPGNNNNTDSGYANWLEGEPNDYWGPSSENQMVIGWLNKFGWNDQGANIGAQGFVVEFDIPTPEPLPPIVLENMETVGIRLEEPPYATLVPSYFINSEHYQTAAVIFEYQPPSSGAVEIAIPSPEEKYPNIPETTFLAAAFHPTLNVLRLKWEVDGVLVGDSEGIPNDSDGGVILHSFTWKTSPGRHTVRTIGAVDAGEAFYSSTIPFFVEGEPQNLPPNAAVKQPADGAVFVEGDPIEVVAEARDPDGDGIAKLELLLDGSAVASTNQPVLKKILREVGVGPHTLHARATDGKGATGLSEPVRILVRHRDAVSFVHRELPETYSPGVAFTVELKAVPPDGTHAYAVEDQPPVGWQVSEISHGGAWDPTNRKVKFGPFTDAQTRLLTYRLAPPADATGRHEFTGSSSINGALYPISGDDSIVLVQQYHPADLNQNFAIVLSEVTAYAAAWKAGDSWPVGPVPIPLSYVTRAGYIWKRGETYRFDPTAGPAPACWVPIADGGIRTLSATSVVGAERSINGSTVTVTATPPEGAASYAIEERPPRGWAVSNISNDGTFDATTGVIRWGVFFDATARTLTYTLIPPASVNSVGTFSGQFSVDGRLADISSANSVTVNGESPIHITDCRRGETGMILNISGPAGQTAVIEGSSDFKTWTVLKSIFIPKGTVEFVDESKPEGPRFYRLRVQ